MMTCQKDPHRREERETVINTEGRHPGTQQIARWFSYGHLPEGEPRRISSLCAEHAQAMIELLPDGPELTAGLRKLLEAKDCFVRAAIDGEE
jgi:hypothetical protein